MKVDIRKASVNELDSIKECISNAFEKYISILGGRPSAMDTDFEPLVKKGQVFVAVQDINIVAMMVMTVQSDYVLIKNVAVNNQFQKKGLGKQLLQYAERETISKGIPVLQLYTNAGLPQLVDYWSRMGFQETERKENNGHTIVFMSKNLNMNLK